VASSRRATNRYSSECVPILDSSKNQQLCGHLSLYGPSRPSDITFVELVLPQRETLNSASREFMLFGACPITLRCPSSVAACFNCFAFPGEKRSQSSLVLDSRRELPAVFERHIFLEEEAGGGGARLETVDLVSGGDLNSSCRSR